MSKLITRRNAEVSHTFEVVTEFPNGMCVWNIGRSNFQFEGYVPLCFEDANYHVDEKRLVALEVGDENLCLLIMKEAGRHSVNKSRFNKIVNSYSKSNKA